MQLLQIDNMTDHLHGLCKTCMTKCSEIVNIGRHEGACHRCKESQPTIIVQQQGLTVAICTKCYLKEQSSPKRSQFRPSHASTLSKLQYYIMVNKPQILNKGFFASEGKMIRKIQKYFLKFQHSEDAFKDMNKKSFVTNPVTWDKIVQKCDKVGSIMYVLVSKSQIFGCYHHQTCKIGDKGFQDSDSGFFLSQRSKIDFQYYKPTHQNLVVYSPSSKSIIIGKPQCFELAFQGSQSKVNCELASNNTEWIYHFVLKF